MPSSGGDAVEAGNNKAARLTDALDAFHDFEGGVMIRGSSGGVERREAEEDQVGQQDE